MKIVQLIALLILIDLGANAQVEVSIIPQPAHAQFNNASFSVTSQTRILAEKGNGEALRIATMLANKLNTAAGLQLKAIESSTQNELGAILFSTQDADPSLGREGY